MTRHIQDYAAGLGLKLNALTPNSAVYFQLNYENDNLKKKDFGMRLFKDQVSLIPLQFRCEMQRKYINRSLIS